MTLDIITIPCLSDNYAYLVKGAAPDEVAVVDAPEAAPIIAALEARGWSPSVILLTHHHGDHTAGVADLVARYGAKTVGPKAEAGKMPPLDQAVSEGDTGGTGAFAWEVIDVPGPTRKSRTIPTSSTGSRESKTPARPVSQPFPSAWPKKVRRIPSCGLAMPRGLPPSGAAKIAFKAYVRQSPRPLA